MAEPPLAVSVVVPVFNRATTLTRALSSLIDQHFTEPFEIIVVDDGSTDGSADVAAHAGGTVRVISQPNAGSSAARARGIDAARGRYVAFLDSDDVARPNHLQTLWSAVHTTPDAVAAFALCDPPEQALARDPGLAALDRQKSAAGFAAVRDPLLLLCQDGCVTVAMNIIARRDDARWASAGRGGVPASTDFDFTLRMALRGPFVFAPRQTIDLERRPDGITARRSRLQAAWAVRVMAEALRLSGRSDGPLRDAARRRIGGLWPVALARSVKARDFGLAWHVLRDGVRWGLQAESVRRLWWALRSQTSEAQP